MTNARARFALLCVLACSVVGAAAPAQADAFITFYNCTSKPSGSWCDGRANGSFDQLDDYDDSEAWYPGSWPSGITVCQRLIKPSDGTVMSGSNCLQDQAYHYYGTVTCNCWESNAVQVSGSNNNIAGSANTN